MKTAFSVCVALVSCSHSQPAPDRPGTAARTRGEIPDLELATRPVDGLPTTELLDPGAREPRRVTEAVAILRSASEHEATGVIRFIEETGRGIRVYASVEGLTNAPHAFHIHLYGDCSAGDFKSAGPHFNFLGSSIEPERKMITGNLGELQHHGNDSMSTANRVIPHASLQGEFSIIGRAVVVHEGGNDPAITPDGGAGARVACGVIGIANPSSPRTVAR